MRLRLLAIGTRLPAWQDAGFHEYARRMPGDSPLELTEIAPARRTRTSDPRRAVAEEGTRLLGAVARDARVVALDERGEAWSTPALAARFAEWRAGGRDVALLVGGPDGLARECLAAAERRWSLSPLTLPHGLVRVVVAEALYRAWTVLARHPYHRAGA